MQYFKELLDLATKRETFCMSTPITIKTNLADGWEQNLYSRTLKYAENNHPFIFTHREVPEAEKNLSSEEATIDAPFPVFSFEVANNSITHSHPIEKLNTGVDVKTKCVMVVEIEPKKYNFVIFFHVDTKIKRAKKTLLYIPYTPLNGDPELIKSYNQYCNLTNHFLKRLSKEKSGIEEVKKKLRFRLLSGKKKAYTFNRVIHVTPKSNISRVKPIASKVINWTHRWSVRGTWRKITGIGKDREDNYCVPNYTWVKPHTKGPQDAPLIIKQRIVKI